MRFHLKATLKTAVLGAVLLLAANLAVAQPQQINLTAAPTTITLPDGSAIPMWGYACGATVSGSLASCATLNPSALGWSPVVITVPTGQDLQINFTNNLPVPPGATTGIPTSLTIVGQLGGGLGDVTQRTTTASPDHSQAQANATWPIAGAGGSTPPTQGPRVQSFSTEVATGATTALTWTAPRPGTYLLESGTHPSIQGPMGLYGMVVVTSAASATTPGTAYPGVSYNTEVPLLFSEIDPAQNRAVTAAVNTAGFSETSVHNVFSVVGSVLVVSGGSGYTTAPSVTLVGGGGTGATATATIDTNPSSPTYGQVTAITVTNGGIDYTTPPTVQITGGGGTGAAGTASLALGANALAHCSGGALACYPPAVNYTPLYYLINGVAFNSTNAPASLFPASIGTALAPVSGNVLVRLVNAGLRMHVPAIVGSLTTQTVNNVSSVVSGFSQIAEDGNPLPGVPRVQSEVFMAAGKTYDVMINVPAAGGTAFPIYDRQLSLSANAVAHNAGMLAYISVNGALLPALPAALTGVKANPDTYNSVIAGKTLTVSDPGKGLVANDLNIFGVAVTTAPTQGTLTLNADGTFTYVASTTWSGSDSFGYCGNGLTAANACTTVTLNPAPIGTAPSAGDDAYNSKTATYINVPAPGVLANDTDPTGYPLTVASPTTVTGSGCSIIMEPNGGFIATGAAATPCTFSYKAQNSQGTLSNSANVSVNFPTPNAPTITVKDAVTGVVVSDYRWIIEEDRTFYINPNCTTNSGTQPAGCPGVVGTGGTVPTFGVNFHTSHMPVVATGCTGPLSCESGQTVLGVSAVCDAGNGLCRPGTQQVAVDPSQVVLDPTKRYYISVLPGDAANPFETGNALSGHGMSGSPIVCIPLAGGPASCDSTGTFSPVTVLVQPNPFQPSKLAVLVFEDDFPLNGEQDGGGGIDVLSPNEPGLGGFNLELFDDAGGTGDPTGQMTYDMFNQPLSNSLSGIIDPITGLDACPISKNALIGVDTSNGNLYGSASPTGITGQIVTCPTYESDGTTLSPLAGQAVVANLMPGRFGVVATPAADRIARGEEWLQTNTLDGQKAHDSFLRIGEPGYFQEFGPAGYHVAIGFANPAIINARHDAVCAGAYGGNPGKCNNTIDGMVTGIRMSRTPDERLYDSGSRDTFSFTQCYVSLGDPDAEDFMFTKCNADGTFSFSGVPDGGWRLTLFDQWNDQIVDGLSTPANVSGGSTLHMGNIGVQQWHTNIYTQTFFDQNGNGLRDNNESGLALVSTNVRFRDGSFSNFNNTDLDGNAGFNEVFPLFNWYVVETDSTRYKSTGTHVVYDAGGPADGTPSCGTVADGNPCGTSTSYNFLANTYERVPLPSDLSVPGAVYCATGADCSGYSIAGGPIASTASNHSTGRIDPPWVTAEAWQGFTGQNSFLEFGKKPFVAGETGGIRGHVVYASTRPFDDPQLLLQTSWAPLVPGVTINLYQEGTAPDGSTSLMLVDTTKTSSWDDWAQGFRSDGKPNMSCPGQLPAPTSTTLGDLFFYTLFDQPSYLDWYNSQHGGSPMTALPYNSQFKCYDGMHAWNQLQPAPYDGMYSFPSMTIDAATGKVNGTNCTICVPDPDSTDSYRYSTGTNGRWDPTKGGTPMLPPGKYVVEVVPPLGYELVKEEDKNILIGDNFIAPVTQEFGGLGSIFILPDQAEVGSAYNSYNAQNPTQGLGRTTFPSSEGDTGSVEVFWPCVGASRIVPDYISLFPQSAEVSPFAGATRNLCDRKEVTLTEQTSALAKFYLYTSTHVAAHYTGVITDDFTSEFDPFAPAFGEKFAPPNLPVSLKDFQGNEISRTYSDHFGLFTGLNYSTWEVNPPNPTGYSPTMMVTCMNDPGPIVDHRPMIVDSNGNVVSNPTYGQTILDPLYNPAYSQFCYELPFMPGQTQYMDTPVVPTEAFAGGYNFPDCQYPDAMPAIKEVDGDGVGPWIAGPGVGHPVTIYALGDVTSTTGTTTNPGVTIPNAGYSGPGANTAPFNLKTITRHYGFGTQCTSPTAGNPTCNTLSTVTIGGKTANIVSWDDTKIVVNAAGISVPQCSLQQQAQYGGPNGTTVSTTRCGQIVITAGNGKQSVDTVTLTIGGKKPTRVAAGQTIQSAIDAAAPGDLIIVPPGTYTEMLIMWKPIRLQGVGAASSVVNANTHPAGKLLQPWREQVNCLFGLALNGAPYTSSTGNNPYDPTGAVSCPGNGWNYFAAQPNVPQIDRLPLEAVVGWTATLNGNLAELLQEPTLMGAYEGAAITVLGKGLDFHGQDPWSDGTEAGAFPTVTTLLQDTPGVAGNSSHCSDAANPFPSNFECNPSGIDGMSFTDSSQGGGGIFVHGWAHNLQIANNRVYNNAGTLSGGISVGQGEFAPAYTVGGTNAAPGSCIAGSRTGQQLPYCLDLNVNVHHNSITGNSSIGDELFSATLSGGGGATFCTGADYYNFNYNWVCGNLSSGEGGGLVHLGFIYNGDIEHNSILFNQSTNPTIPTNGGGLMIEGTPDTDPVCGAIPDADCPPGLSDGTGPGLVINANLIQGNSADSGSGGGLRLQSVNGTEVSAFPNPGTCVDQAHCLWYAPSVTNNVIVNNIAGWDGAGVSLQDALVANLVNNTIAHNDSTATSGVLINTLGAPLASAPPGTCTQSGPNGPTTASCPQVSGLVSMANTSLLTTTFVTPITCPASHPNCTAFSSPLLSNNVLWQNRSFQIGVGGLAAGFQNQQAVVTLYNASFNRTSVGPAVISQTGTGSCNDTGANYWDVGVRGDFGPGSHESGFTLNPQYSVLSPSATGYSATNLTSDPTVVSQYCNGSRVPPECTVANGCVSGAGWAVPPGISDAVVPNPVFSLTPAATVDEGNNWINLTWGPLSLTNPALQGTDGNWGGGSSLGNYALQSTSPAADYVPVTIAHPSADFFGNPRPDPANPTCFDVGAVEFQGTTASNCAGPPTLTAISPTSGARGSTNLQITLTGTNLTGATALTGLTGGVSLVPGSISVNAGGTQLTALLNITRGATLGVRNIGVTTPAGTSNTEAFRVVGAVIAFSGPTPPLNPGTLGTHSGTLTVLNTANLTLGANAGPFTFTADPSIAKVSGAGNGTFTITGGTCVSGYVINPGSSCTINVQYAGETNTSTANGRVTIAGTGTTTATRTVTFPAN